MWSLINGTRYFGHVNMVVKNMRISPLCCIVAIIVTCGSENKSYHDLLNNRAKNTS